VKEGRKTSWVRDEFAPGNWETRDGEKRKRVLRVFQSLNSRDRATGETCRDKSLPEKLRRAASKAIGRRKG